MILPELDFKPATLHEEELFLGPNWELSKVLVQDNPVYLDLLLPSVVFRHQVRIGFPQVGRTWVYADIEDPEKGLVCEVTERYGRSEGTPFDSHLKYRFGMELKPWMFFCWLDPELRAARSMKDNVVNYVVMACSSGWSGVLIRIARGHDREALAREWIEIYHFSTGNDSSFASKWRDDPNTKLLARFVPREAGTPALHWVPEPLPA